MEQERHGPYLDIPKTPSAMQSFNGEGDDAEYIGNKATVSSLLTPDRQRSLSPGPLSPGHLPPDSWEALSPAPQPRPRAWRSRLARIWGVFWSRNRAVILVATAQMFGSSMNVMARLLELEGEGMHPFQILFARMGITAIACCIYMFIKKIPHFPFGPPEVRWLLIARGFFGFFGIYGMWCSIMYLPLAEATVISFLAPCLAGYLCHLILKDPFTRREQIGSFVALFGVLLIARPASLFNGWGADRGTELPGAEELGSGASMAANFTQAIPREGEEPTDSERLSAIGFALIGVLGAAGAYTTIRWIGKRAHPLISVNYFSTWCTIVSTTVLLTAPALGVGQPGLQFAFPSTLRQWTLLIGLGVCGFILQFLLTAGLSTDKTNRATAMVYTQMLFAAGFDKWIFGYEMGPVSLVGCGLIISSLLWVALSKNDEREKHTHADLELGVIRDLEGAPMLGADRGRGDLECR